MNQIASAGVVPPTSEELRRMDVWRRAANYLNVGQIYLSANPLLREKLTVDHVKPHLLGTSPECSACSGNSRRRAAFQAMSADRSHP